MRWAPSSPPRRRSSSRPTTSTPSPSARRPTPTSICSSRARPPASRSSARSPCRSTWPRWTGAWRPWTRPACCCRSASTAATTPATARSASGWPDGDIGQLHLVRITSRDPAPPPIAYIEVSGGIFCDMTIHDFDMARFVTGSEIEEVYATGAVRVDPAIGEAGDLDTAVVVLRHADGVPHDDRQQPPGRLRLRPAGRGLRVGRHGRLGERAHDHDHPAQRQRGPAVHPAGLLPGALRDELPRRVGGLRGRGPRRRALTRRRPRRPRGLIAGLAAWRSVREGRPIPTSEITGP